MIELQDAIERAKLAADTNGHISSYTYDRISEQLDTSDLHAFTLALVDLGIRAKYGSLDDEAHMAHVLAMPEHAEAEAVSDNRKISIIEEFVKAAQQFVQSPGGLWMPDTWKEEEEEAPSDKFEFDPGEEEDLQVHGIPAMDPDFGSDFEIPGVPAEDVNFGLDDPNIGYEFEGGQDPSLVDDPIYEVGDEDIISEKPLDSDQPEAEKGPKEDPKEDEGKPLSDDDKASAASIRDILESNGIQVSPDGMVSRYSTNDRGRFMDQSAMKPMPVGRAAGLFKRQLTGLQKEKERVSQLQDILSALNGEFDDIGEQLSSLSGQFNETYDNLERFKYSASNGDETIQQIGSGLDQIREYLTAADPNIKDVWKSFESKSTVIDDLQKNLDEYFQRQYSSIDGASELVDAMMALKEAQGTPMFNEIVGTNMGGVTAKFKQAMRKLEAQMSYGDMTPDPPNVPEYGSLTVEIGIDWLYKTFEELAPGEGANILQAFLSEGGYEHPDALSGLIDEWKRYYGVGLPEDAEAGDEVEVRIEQVPSPSDEVGLELGTWEENPPDPDGRPEPGYHIGDILYIQDTQKIQQDLKEDLKHIVDMFQEGVY